MRRTAIALTVLLAGTVVHAATYKWIDSEGRVNYGDRPPDPGMTPMTTPAVAAPSPSPGDASAEAALPYLVRMVSERNPVTLYTGRECGACDSARTHLLRRGVPFAERLLLTDRDLEAFRQLGFNEAALPAITVGRERVTSYESARLDRLLDAAGYPKTSTLPPRWRPSPAQPLAPASDAAVEQTPTAPAPSPAEILPPLRVPGPGPTPDRPPTSIRF